MLHGGCEQETITLVFEHVMALPLNLFLINFQTIFAQILQTKGYEHRWKKYFKIFGVVTKIRENYASINLIMFYFLTKPSQSKMCGLSKNAC